MRTRRPSMTMHSQRMVLKQININNIFHSNILLMKHHFCSTNMMYSGREYTGGPSIHNTDSESGFSFYVEKIFGNLKDYKV